ncbi:MAG TPA: SDR family oxidoreductase [Nitriliruptoraceae bacterium]|nr:SDR family oxidoreductase [Nitriliruptoraceae bacterium]
MTGGRVAVVRGCLDELGSAVVRRFAADGTALVLAGGVDDRSGLADLAAAAATVVEVVTGDLDDPATARRAVDTARERLGRLDHLVDLTVASTVDHRGDAPPVPALDAARAALLPARRAYFFASAAARGLRAGGSIVVSLPPSTFASAPASAAVHGAMTMLVRSFALELAPYRVRVNGVLPGLIETRLVEAWPDDEPSGATAVPLGRAGRPDEVAEAIAFLLGEDASFMTGSILPVDGGLTATAPTSRRPAGPAGPGADTRSDHQTSTRRPQPTRST